jgi:hypothetical protein
MVAVLFAASRIAAHSLDMTVGVRGNPDVRPGWRDCQTMNSLEYLGIANGAPGLPVSKIIRTIADPLNAGMLVGNVSQSGHFCGCSRTCPFGSR